MAAYNEVADNKYSLSVGAYVEQEGKREKIGIAKLNVEIEEIVARERYCARS